MKPRNPHALRARQRKAGPMGHKTAPRGGARSAARAEVRAELHELEYGAAIRRQLRVTVDVCYPLSDEIT